MNIVDLGLVYACRIDPSDAHRINIRMTLTAPGCGMGPVLVDEIKLRLLRVPNVDRRDGRPRVRSAVEPRHDDRRGAARTRAVLMAAGRTARRTPSTSTRSATASRSSTTGKTATIHHRSRPRTAADARRARRSTQTSSAAARARCGSTTALEDGRLYFTIDSDALIVRGLIAIVLAAFDGRTPAAILAYDIDGLFGDLDLLRHLSPTRGNGLPRWSAASATSRPRRRTTPNTLTRLRSFGLVARLRSLGP